MLNSSVLKTLDQNFPRVLVIPGNYNYFYASNSTISAHRATLVDRWRERKIGTIYFNEHALVRLLDRDRIGFVAGAIKTGTGTRENHDLVPVSFLLSLLYSSSRFGPRLYHILDIKWEQVLLFILGMTAVAKAAAVIFKGSRPSLIILLLSFFGMSCSILIINTFQALYGYAYLAVAWIITLYMSGLTAGSLLINLNYERAKDPALILRLLVSALIVFLLFFLILIDRIYLPAAAFFASLPLGMAFPLAVKLGGKEGKNYGSLAGLLYGMDLLGGGAAAFIITIFFVPAFGIIKTLGLLLVICAGALLIV